MFSRGSALLEIVLFENKNRRKGLQIQEVTMLVFRTYRRIAQRQHWCDVCCTYIEAGEFYEGSVHLYDGHRLIVFKKHVEPSCDYPPEPEDYDWIEDTCSEEVPMKLAA